jgi:hypothetical protein
MEISPLSLESVLDWLQKQAAKAQTPVVIQARIAVGQHETRLLTLQPEGLLETIHY